MARLFWRHVPGRPVRLWLNFLLGLACEGCYCYQTFRTLYDFAGGSDGAYLYGGVAFDANNYAYVTTLYGGSHGLGTVFSMYAPKSDQMIQDNCDDTGKL